MMNLITQSRLKELLNYDPETGVFTWAVKRAAVKPGDIAGCTSEGYWLIKVHGKMYQAHRLAWLWVHGAFPEMIDHINGVTSDNRLCNLRAATNSQNQANSRMRVNNTSGHKGVVWDKQCRKWAARINVRNRRLYLGVFDNIDAASAAYSAAAKKYFGEFARQH
jgi:hypothetical protein